MKSLNYKHFGLIFLASLILSQLVKQLNLSEKDNLFMGMLLGATAFVSFIAMVVSCIFTIIRDYKKNHAKT